MSKSPTLLALLVSLCVTVPATAQTRSPEAQPAPAATGQKPPQHINIEDGSDVDGVRVNPNVELVNVRGRLRPSSLITIRTHFQAELLKSAESL
jgi:hypothetical protein